MSADAYQIPAAHRPVMERATYVPSWYKEHLDLTLQVVDDQGGDMEFVIGQVLPERRWAIDSTGRLLPQDKFEERYRDWISRVLVKDGRLIAMNAVNKYFDVTLESVPSVDDFVDAKLDPMKPGELRFVPINYHNIENAARTKIRPIYNVMGQKVVAGATQPAPEIGFTPLPVAEDPKESLVVVACGKEVKAGRVNQHQSICKACKMAMKAKATEETAA